MTELDKTILAYMLKDKQFALELSNKTSEEYYTKDLRWLFNNTISHFNNPKFKEIPTLNVIEDYIRKGTEDKSLVAGRIKTFKEIKRLGETLDGSEFTWHLSKLRVRYVDHLQKKCITESRQLIKTEGLESRVEQVSDAMRKAVVEIDSVDRKEAYKEGTLAGSAEERLLRYKAVEENPELARGLHTGLTELDRITNGLHGGEMMLVGGRSSTGKSILMQNVAINAWLGGNSQFTLPIDSGIPGCHVLYYSIEMPKENQERRIDACLAGVQYKHIRDGLLNIEDREKYYRTLEFQKAFPYVFHIVDMPRGVTVREIELKHQELEKKYGIKFGLTAVDYLGIMKPVERQQSDWKEQGVIAEELHEYARTYDIPVISAVQLNRPKDANNEDKSTGRIARSDMIPANANIILQIAYRGDDEYTRLDMPVYITKMRDGEKGSFTLVKNFACMQVTDMVDETFGSYDEEDDDDDIL